MKYIILFVLICSACFAANRFDDVIVDNLRLNGNTISTEDTDGNLILSPNGVGIIDAAQNIESSKAGSFSVKSKDIDDSSKNSERVFFQSGHQLLTSTGDTGDVFLRTGECRDDSVNCESGRLTVQSGDMESPLESTDSGDLRLFSGDNDGLGESGSITMETGDLDNSLSSDVTGLVIIMSGNNAGTGATGSTTVETGNQENGASSAESGFTRIRTGSSAGSGNTGALFLTTGFASATGASGRIDISTGNTTNSQTGNISVFTGTPSDVTEASGSIDVRTGSGSDNSGNLQLLSGDVLTSGTSGNITLTIGNAPSGTRGNIFFEGGTVFISSGGTDANFRSENTTENGGIDTQGLIVQSGHSENGATASTGLLLLRSGEVRDTSDGSTGNVTLHSGDQENAGSAGNSGNLTLRTGTVAGAGARGSISLTASLIDHTQTVSNNVVWESGATASRPGSPIVGQRFFDTDLGSPIIFDGSVWLENLDGANKTLSNLTIPTALNGSVTGDFVGSFIFKSKDIDDSSVDSQQAIFQSGHQLLSSVGNTGNIIVRSGECRDTSTCTSGRATFQSGDMEAPAGTTDSGDVRIFSGDNDGLGESGSITMETGDIDNAASTDVTGLVIIMSGNNAGTGTTGSTTVETGNQENAASSAESGFTRVRTGSSAGSGNTGALFLTTGFASATGASGRIDISTGNTTNSQSGNISVFTGTPSDVTEASGSIDIRSGGGADNSGNVQILSGDVLTSGTSGNIILTIGSAPSGTRGNIFLEGGTIFASSGGTDANIRSENTTQNGGIDTQGLILQSGHAENGASVTSTGNVTLRTGEERDTSVITNTGNLSLFSGDAENAGSAANTGSSTLRTGNVAGSGDSGDLNLLTGTVVGGTRGDLTLTANSMITSGAILPITDNTQNIGSSSFRYNQINLSERVNLGTSGQMILRNTNTTPSGATASEITTEASSPIALTTASNAAADANPTQDVLIESGNKSAGSGDSGDVILRTGTSAGGTRGKISFVSNTVELQTNLVPSAAGVLDIGSSALRFEDVYAEDFIVFTSGGSGVGTLKGGITKPSGGTMDIGIEPSGSSATVGLITRDNASGTQPMFLETGNAASGTSGDINIRTGTGVTRGTVNLTTDKIKFEDVFANKLFLDTVDTTDATQTTLFAFTTATDTSYYAEFKLVALRTGGAAGAAGDTATYNVNYFVKNVAGTVTVTQMSRDEQEDQAAFDAIFVASGTALNLDVTGVVNNDVTWNAKVELIEN